MAHVNNAVYADWLEEAVIAAGDHAPRRAPCHASPGWSTPRRPTPPRELSGDVWRSDGGWSFLLRDAAGRELLRARLEPGAALGREGLTAPERKACAGSVLSGHARNPDGRYARDDARVPSAGGPDGSNDSTGSTVPNLETIRIVLIEPRALVGARDPRRHRQRAGHGGRGRGPFRRTMPWPWSRRAPPDVFVIDVELQEPATSAATRRLTQERRGPGSWSWAGRTTTPASSRPSRSGRPGTSAPAAEPAELVAVIRRVADGEDPLRTR